MFKKIHSLIFVAISSLIIFAFFPLQVTALTKVDQQNSTNIGPGSNGAEVPDSSGNPTGNHQTFKPTTEKITEIRVYLLNRVAGSSIRYTVSGLGDTYQQAKSVSGNGAGWESINVSFDVTPGGQYYLQIEIAPDQTPATKWAMSGSNAYANGEGFISSAATGNDYGFVIVGEYPDPTSAPSASPSPSATASPTVTPSPTPTSTADSIVVTRVIRNSLSVNFDNDTVNFADGDKFEVRGKADPDKKILFEVNDSEYTVETDSSGNWRLEFEPSEADSDRDTLEIKANYEGETGFPIELLKLERQSEQTSPTPTPASTSGGSNVALIGALILLAAIVTGGGVYYFMKKQKSNKQAEPVPQETTEDISEPDDAEPASAEEVAAETEVLEESDGSAGDFLSPDEEKK